MVHKVSSVTPIEEFTFLDKEPIARRRDSPNHKDAKHDSPKSKSETEREKTSRSTDVLDRLTDPSKYTGTQRYLKSPIEKQRSKTDMESEIKILKDAIKTRETELLKLTVQLQAVSESKAAEKQIYENKITHLEQSLETEKTARKLVEAENNRRKIELQAEIDKAITEIAELKKKQIELETEASELRDQLDETHNKTSSVVLRMTLEEGAKQRRQEVPPPIGSVTLIFTDVQSSTSQWEKDPNIMLEAMQLHNDLMRSKLEQFRGYEVKTEGDAFMIAFETPEKALLWCLAVQEELLKVEWPTKLLENEDSKEEKTPFGHYLYRGLRVRMGIHSGEPTCKVDPVTGRMDYFGKMVNRAARVAATGHGGQIVVSGTSWDRMDHKKFTNILVTELGSFRLKGLESDEKIIQVMPKALALRTFAEISTDSESSGMKNLKEELTTLKNINELLQDKLDKLELQLAEVNEEIVAVTAKLNELRSGEGNKELSKALESVENIIIVQDSISNVIKKISEDKEKVNDTLGHMKTEFNTLRHQLSNEKSEKSKLQVTVQDLEARLTELMKKMEKPPTKWKAPAFKTLEEHVHYYNTHLKLPSPIRILDTGHYLIGTKKMPLSVSNSVLFVRVGGGVTKFEDWLYKYAHREGIGIPEGQ